MLKVLEAIRFADRKHKGQVRKGNGHPYVTHPIAASYLLVAFKQSKNLEALICAMILHDVVEDTGTPHEEIVKLFGMLVASLVFELTSDKEEIKRVGKTEYMKKRWVSYSSYALVCKLCDRLHNMSSAPSDKQKQETCLILDHLEKNRKLTATHKRIIAEIRKVIQ